MILLDYSNVVTGNIHSSADDKGGIDEDFVRHTILNSLLSYNKKFSKRYGELVLCADMGSWRKKVFPYYKAHRSADRDDSKIDWDLAYKIINKITAEIKDVFPYKVIQIPGAEGDDIIAQLTLHKYPGEKIMIVSADHDMKQLHTSADIKQYSPLTKDYVTCDNPSMYLKTHTIKGDSGDGIPNILMPADFFVEKKRTGLKTRQKSVFQKKLDVWLNQKPEQFCTEEQLERYYENKGIIDLRECPDSLRKEIIKTHREYVVKDKSKILDYMISNKLKILTEDIGDF